MGTKTRKAKSKVEVVCMPAEMALQELRRDATEALKNRYTDHPLTKYEVTSVRYAKNLGQFIVTAMVGDDKRTRILVGEGRSINSTVKNLIMCAVHEKI